MDHLKQTFADKLLKLVVYYKRYFFIQVDPDTGVLDFANGKEWCVLKLGVPGVVKKIEVDTNHFKGNFPDSIVVEARSGINIFLKFQNYIFPM